MNKIAYVIGGGTVNHVSSHLAISAPAYGSTAKRIAELLKESIHTKNLDAKLVLTKMADSSSKYETNEDVSNLVDEIVADPSVKMVFFNAAMADFEGQIEGLDTGKYEHRLSSANSYDFKAQAFR